MDTSSDNTDEIRRLFFEHVPELQSGRVQIKAIARERCDRSMLVVYSDDPHVDPVGACVGHRGDRVKRIMKQLGGEFVDIVRWSDSVEQLISDALASLRPGHVKLDHETGRALVPVQNCSTRSSKSDATRIRLASKVTGWEICLLEL